MILHYRHPDTCRAERRYIAKWLFEEIFGWEVRFEAGAFPHQTLQAEGARESLVLPDTFLSAASKNWLGVDTLPKEPLWRSPEGLPVLYGRRDGIQEGERSRMFSIDVLGSLFFLLSSYEEAVVEERDHHGRFPSQASVLKRENLLHRAIGNEYIETLWREMTGLWPGLTRRSREFRIQPSHDIDVPSFYWRRSAGAVIRESARQLVKFRCALGALRVAGGGFVRGPAQWRLDPFETIEAIMDQSEACGLKSVFNYIPERTSVSHDVGMPLDHPQIESQWRNIAARNHEIGIHPGYETCEHPERIARGATLIRRQLEKLKIDQEILGGRQHFLRWNSRSTARSWEAAGLSYDSTLGFADQCGFRCGVCYEFPLYDLENRRVLALRERPLIAMDCTVLDDAYMGLGSGEEAFQYLFDLRETCRKYEGDFTILWHNNRLVNPRERDLYQAILSAPTERPEGLV
ncbi:MAG: polysaccharide deacetylase family protein [Akkermansiaceae bacterium]